MLDTVIISHYMKIFGWRIWHEPRNRIGCMLTGPLVRILRRHHARQVTTIHPGLCLGFGHQLLRAASIDGDHTAHYAMCAEMPHECPRVNFGDDGHTIPL